MIVERGLAALALAAALGAAWAEGRSTLAPRVRDGRPWLAWVEARQAGATVPDFSLAVYDASARRLALLHVPGATKLEGRRTLERAYAEAFAASGGRAAAARAAEDLAEEKLKALSPEPIPPSSARLRADLPPLAEEDEPAVETALALKASARSPRAWARLLRGAASALRASDANGLDALLFALELRRVPREGLAPARLPEDAQAPDFLGRLLASAPPPEDGKPAAIEVLNGTDSPGLASRAAKMLRWRGVDVLATGTAAARARTLVYDRSGDFRKAARALAALGCPSARAVTRVDPSRAVDVTVALGADCAAAFGTGGGREP